MGLLLGFRCQEKGITQDTKKQWEGTPVPSPVEQRLEEFVVLKKRDEIEGLACHGDYFS
jgi:hypothetical protein